MSRNRYIFAICAALSTWCSYADEGASTIQTSGTAELGIVSNYLLFSSEKKHSISVPYRISVGDTLQISYVDGSKSTSKSFPVVWISSRSNICWLHDRDRTAGSPMSDTIYVMPCKKLQ